MDNKEAFNNKESFNKLLALVFQAVIVYIVTAMFVFASCALYDFSLDFGKKQKLLISSLPILTTAYFVMYTVVKKD